jgi:hypothetical protein
MDKQETNAGVSYERKDVTMRLVVALLVSAGCFVTLVSIAIWWFYWAEESSQKAAKGSTAALAPLFPAEPRLEEIDKLAGVDSSDVAKRLVAQEKQLNSYGPTDEKGFVHVPIQQAIEAVADKLPVRKQPPGKAMGRSGPTDAGASSPGRPIRGEP